MKNVFIQADNNDYNDLKNHRVSVVNAYDRMKVISQWKGIHARKNVSGVNVVQNNEVVGMVRHHECRNLHRWSNMNFVRNVIDIKTFYPKIKTNDNFGTEDFVKLYYSVIYTYGTSVFRKRCSVNSEDTCESFFIFYQWYQWW